MNKSSSIKPQKKGLKKGFLLDSSTKNQKDSNDKNFLSSMRRGFLNTK